MPSKITLTRIINGLVPGIHTKYPEYIDSINAGCAEMSPEEILPHTIVWRIVALAKAGSGRPVFLKDHKTTTAVISTIGTSKEEVEIALNELKGKFTDEVLFEDLGDDLLKVQFTVSDTYLEEQFKSINKNTNVYRLYRNLAECSSLFYMGREYRPGSLLGVLSTGVGITSTTSSSRDGYKFAVPESFNVPLDLKTYAEYILTMNGVQCARYHYPQVARSAISVSYGARGEVMALVSSNGPRICLQVTVDTKKVGFSHPIRLLISPNVKDLKVIKNAGLRAFLSLHAGNTHHQLTRPETLDQLMLDPSVIQVEGLLGKVTAHLDNFKADGKPKTDKLQDMMEDIQSNAPFLVTQTLTPGLAALVESLL